MRARQDAMAQEKSIYRTGSVVGVTSVANYINGSFPEIQSNRTGRVITAGASALPLWLLPAKPGKGFGNFVSRPGVWGTALIGGMAVVREIFPPPTPQGSTLAAIQVVPPVALPVGSSAKILVDGFDSNSSVTFKSSKKTKATVNKKGTVKGKKKGPVTITVTGDGKSASIPMMITK
jgi:hypothetical protein